MLAQTFGRLRQEAGGRRGVRFERVYDYTPQELWAALTEPDQLGGWLGPAEVDLRVGGRIVIRFAEDENETVHGVIRKLEPMRVLEYDWNFPGESESVLRLELQPREHGTLLVLDHRRLGDEQATGYGAGWHSHLDALELMLAGRSHDWEARFGQLLPSYRERADALAGDARLGTLRREGDRRGVRYERVVAASPEEVWQALTEPARLRVWMDAEAVVEPRLGGRFALRWSEDESMEGVIRSWEPRHVLAFTWRHGRDESVVRFELAAVAEGTRLVLDHSALSEKEVVSVGAGWHSHLDWLDVVVQGGDFDFGSRYRELQPVYEDVAAAL